MAIKIGNKNIDKAYLGGVEIKKLYLGSNLIFDNTFIPNQINPMFDNAVAYYIFDETTGDAIDLVNGYNGTLNGNISRNGEYYTFNSENDYIDIGDEDDFSFTDGNGNNTDFVIKTEVVFDDINSQNRAWLVSKRESNQAGVNEWQLVFFENQYIFQIWDSSSNRFEVRSDFIPTVGQKYIIGVTLNETTLSLFIDGVIEQTETLPVGFTFYNGTSIVKLGNETFTGRLNLKGKIKETVIIKGSGWSQQNITDNYNNGNGITY
jgi:hypothetical protein